MSFISPSASYWKTGEKNILPLFKLLRNGLRCGFGLASVCVIHLCSVESQRVGGHNIAQWIVITKPKSYPGLDTSKLMDFFT